MDIAGLRERIDAIDVALVELLNQRGECARQIGYLKRALHAPIYEPQREVDVLNNVIAHNRGPLSDVAVRRLFERVIDEMRTIQKDELLKKTEAGSGADRAQP